MSDPIFAEVRIIEPRVFADERGFFLEVFNEARYTDLGIGASFVQDNWSHSVKGTLRGLHFQEPNPQGKLVSVATGAIWDVVVDVRTGSPTFGRWSAIELSTENKRQVWVPAGFAHGFCVLSETADFVYKCTSLYDPACERSLLWSDPDLGIPWPVTRPLLSAKDAQAPRLRDQPALPAFRS